MAACKRIYGDWSDVRLKSWKDALLNNSIIPIQQYSYTTGKNATDSAMIIDAMDLLYGGNLDGFCIVSSDSDFTRLAARLREAGKLVIGMGESKALGPFVKACDQFKYLDLILDHGETDDTAPAAPAAEAAARANAGDDTAINRDSIGRIIHGLIDEMDDGTGWVRTSRVGDQLIKRYPDFDVRNFGSKSLNKFLASLPELEVEERILANGNPIQFVRVKPAPKPVKACQAQQSPSAKEVRRDSSLRQTTEKGAFTRRPPLRTPTGRWGRRTVRFRCKPTTGNSPGHIACVHVPKPENLASNLRPYLTSAQPGQCSGRRPGALILEEGLSKCRIPAPARYARLDAPRQYPPRKIQYPSVWAACRVRQCFPAGRPVGRASSRRE